MLAIRNKHDLFTSQMRNRLKTIGMGLGLVRLLQDARRAEEARTTLASLGIAETSAKPSQKHCKANRFLPRQRLQCAFHHGITN